MTPDRVARYRSTSVCETFPRLVLRRSIALAPVSFPFVSVPDHRAQTQQGYDTVAGDYARLLPALNAETSLDIAMIDGFADRCASARLGPVADAGCGTGRVSAYLAARGLDVIGIDLSPGMVDVARRTYPELHFEVGALEELPLPDASLGGLVAWYSIIHTAPERLPVIVAQAARALRPGAWLLAAFQAGDGQRVDRTSAYGQPVTMTNYRHDPEHVVDVLEDHGFKIRARLHRAAEGTEKAPQFMLLASI